MIKTKKNQYEETDATAYTDSVYSIADTITTTMDQCGFKESAFLTDVAICVLCIRMLNAVPVKACRLPSDRIAPILERVEGIASDILLREMEREHAPIAPVYKDIETTQVSPELSVIVSVKCDENGCGKCSCTRNADTYTDYGEDITDREVPDCSFTTLEEK